MTPEGLLDLWDRMSVADARMRDHMLAVWGSATDPDHVARRPLGEAQRGRVAAWRALLGSPLDAVADCPACQMTLELSIEPDALPQPASSTPQAVVADDGSEIVPRLLTPADLDAVAGLQPAEARVELARRALGVDDPSVRLQQAVAAALQAADPASSWWAELCCPGCGHTWEEPLEIGAFLWHAVDQAARRLLREVADLAAAFGWSEATVVALPPARRAAYLALAGR